MLKEIVDSINKAIEGYRAEAMPIFAIANKTLPIGLIYKCFSKSFLDSTDYNKCGLFLPLNSKNPASQEEMDAIVGQSIKIKHSVINCNSLLSAVGFNEVVRIQLQNLIKSHVVSNVDYLREYMLNNQEISRAKNLVINDPDCPKTIVGASKYSLCSSYFIESETCKKVCITPTGVIAPRQELLETLRGKILDEFIDGEEVGFLKLNSYLKIFIITFECGIKRYILEPLTIEAKIAPDGNTVIIESSERVCYKMDNPKMAAIIDYEGK